ncbi:MAG: DUF1080 domain-containing protein [Sedimentisphaerales bacterium]|nr:DUF1080 domain-containing protein [Sedimentisphaerales bacterium]
MQTKKFADSRNVTVVILVGMFLASLFGSLSAPAAQGALNEPPEGFVALFNGKDLTGWKGLVADPPKRAKMTAEQLAQAQAKADEVMREHWKVVDGVLVFDGHGSHLCTVKDYENFEMLVDWKIEAGGDSGIYLRGSPQVQIWDPAQWPQGSGGLYNNQKNPSNPLLKADNPIGQWNHFRIIMIGQRVTVFLNDQLVVDDVIMENYWERDKPIYPVAQIELQSHGSTLNFRNVFIRELTGAQPLFNGRDLTGWEMVGGQADSWAAVDGVLTCMGKGGGWLSTTKEFDNFELSLEYKVPAGGNSGVFIRAPREGNPAYAGSEIQVLDDYADIYKDLKPWQFTGSVYATAAPSKRVSKKADQWQHMVILCDDKQVRVTLNDQDIVDTDLDEHLDKLQDHPGLARTGGYLGLQNHGSKLEYRNITLRPINHSGEYPKLDTALNAIVGYEFGQSRLALTELANLVRDSQGKIWMRKHLERGLAKILSSPSATWAAKQFACRQLSLIGTAASADALAPLLAKTEFADMARYALERIPGNKADQTLLAGLNTADAKIKIGIINSLAARRTAAAIPMLIDLLASADVSIAAASASALGKIGSEPAAAALKKAKSQATGALLNEVLDAYLNCAATLVADGETALATGIYRDLYQESEPPRVRTAALNGLVQVDDKTAFAEVIKLLTRDDSPLQAGAIGLVRELPGQQRTLQLAAQLEKMTPAGQVLLLGALADRGDSAALNDILKISQSSDGAVRIAALQAIGKLGSAQQVLMLAQRAGTTSGPEQDAARNSLNILPGAQVNDAIAGELTQADAKVKVELIRSLNARAAKEKMNEIIQAALVEDVEVKIEAFKALSELAGEAELPLLTGLLVTSETDQERKEAENMVIAVARKVSDPVKQVEVVLVSLKTNPKPALKNSLLRVLGRLSSPAGLPALRNALNDEDSTVRVTAIRALAEWPTADPADDLLKVAKSNAAENQKILALRGYIRLTGLAQGNRLGMYKIAMRNTQRNEEKKLVLAGVANENSPAALQMAQGYLDDADLKAEAIATILKIGEAIADKNKSAVKIAMKKVLDATQDENLRKKADEILKKTQ